MNWLLQMTVPVLAGFVLDLLLGDPAWLYHPVRLIGLLIEKGEKIIRKCLPKTRGGERLGGVVLVIFVVSISALVPLGILLAAYRFFVPLGLLIESFFCYQILAVKSLKVESDRVCRALKEEGLISGRKAVSMIVGRDTEGLSEEGVTKAAVETVAENTSDGVIAPLFYMVIGGAVLGFAYKAVNTMDSMIGYKNDKYRYFGTAAARLDDAANFLPSRLAALLMIAASFLLGMDGPGAFRIYCRDRKESVMAGALGVELAGNAWYFGKLYEKPTIGDPKRPIEIEDIRRSHRLLYGTSILALAVFMGIKCCLLWL